MTRCAFKNWIRHLGLWNNPGNNWLMICKRQRSSCGMKFGGRYVCRCLLGPCLTLVLRFGLAVSWAGMAFFSFVWFLPRFSWPSWCIGMTLVLLGSHHIWSVGSASVLQARKLFLTNYYDPFNPDLFLYTTNPDTQYTATTTSWNLVVRAVLNGDLKAFTGVFRSNISLLIKRWHQQIWVVWGDDPTRPVGAWPPTWLWYPQYIILVNLFGSGLRNSTSITCMM